MTPTETGRIGRREIASTGIIWFERLWGATWPTSGVVAIFVAIALLDVLPQLPVWLHILLLLGFVGALGLSLRIQVQRLRRPNRFDGRRRLEQVNDLPHRPLTGLQEELTSGLDDPGSRALWRRHQARIAAQLAGLRVGWPKSMLPLKDQRAFRLAAGLLLVIGLFSGGGDAGARLLRAIEPQFGPAVPDVPISAEIQITPPAYTSVAPIFFDGTVAAGGAIGVPSGSRLLVQVHNSENQPALSSVGSNEALQRFSEQTWRTESVVEVEETTQTEITVSVEDEQLLQLPVVVVPDARPLVTFATPPAATQRAALRLQFTVADDYGVDRVQAHVTRPGGPVQDASRALALDLPLSGRAANRRFQHQFSRPNVASLGRFAGRDPATRDRQCRSGRPIGLCFLRLA